MLSVCHCASSYITQVVKLKPEQPYVNLMILYVENSSEINRLDETTFNAAIRHKFNNLNSLPVRRQLEKSFIRAVGISATQMNSASDFFEVGADYTFEAFMSKVKESGVEAVVVFNQNSYWRNVNSYTTTNQKGNNITTTESSPNAGFLCYLLDVKTGASVWISKTTVNGTPIDGYDSMNNSLTRKVSWALIKGGYIDKYLQ